MIAAADAVVAPPKPPKLEDPLVIARVAADKANRARALIEEKFAKQTLSVAAMSKRASLLSRQASQAKRDATMASASQLEAATGLRSAKKQVQEATAAFTKVSHLCLVSLFSPSPIDVYVCPLHPLSPT